MPDNDRSTPYSAKNAGASLPADTVAATPLALRQHGSAKLAWIYAIQGKDNATTAISGIVNY